MNIFIVLLSLTVQVESVKTEKTWAIPSRVMSLFFGKAKKYYNQSDRPDLKT